MTEQVEISDPREPRKSQALQDFETLIERVANADVKPISLVRAAVQSP